MGLDLYYIPFGMPSRGVMLLARALDVSLNLKFIDVLSGENRSEEFLKINPQHTVPCLVDDDLIISESAAILMYLADAYGKDDSLYPKDLKERAMVNQRLFFNSGVITGRIVSTYVIPIMQKRGIDHENMPNLDDAFIILNKYLDGSDWVCGEQITIADYATFASVSTAEAIGYDLTPYEHVTGWLVRCREVMEDYETLNDLYTGQFADKLAEMLRDSE